MTATATSVLSPAAERIAARLKALAERPDLGLTVRDLIHRRMAIYAGRDHALAQRLAVWDELLGDFSTGSLTRDVMREARVELQALPAVNYKGLDHQGRAIFKPKARATKTPATVNRYMAAISSVFTWAIEERLVPRDWTNPCLRIKQLPGERERLRFLDADERQRLFAACKESSYRPLYALVLGAMLTGARKGELMGLRRCDVVLEAGLARLGRTKNGDRRTLVLLPQVVEAWRPFVPDSSRERYVFGSSRRAQRAPASIDSVWCTAIARAGIRDFRFHDLRHCCASYLAQAGKPLNVIAEVLGHRKLDMTRRYAHLTIHSKAEAMQDALGTIGT